MASHVRQTDALTDAEKQQLFGWGENIFGVAELGLSWRPKEVHFLRCHDGAPVSHVGVLKHAMCVNGTSMAIAGIGGVVTVPGARGKGFARGLLEHALAFARREWAVQAGMLFCLPRMSSYYEALGWLHVRAEISVEQPGGRKVSPLRVMVLPFDDLAWARGPVELDSLPW